MKLVTDYDRYIIISMKPLTAGNAIGNMSSAFLTEVKQCTL